jgi:hypothetical protein
MMRSIRILGIEYALESKKFNDEEQFGESCEQTCIISIRDNLNKDVFEETLLHEIIHQIDDRLNLGMTENQVHCISVGLYCVSKENNIHFVMPNKI